MDLRALGLAFAALGLLVSAGCSDRKAADNYPDASVFIDASPDVPRSGTGGRPAPEIKPGNRMIVPGLAGLIGSGADSCTHEVGATGERWCGFATPSNFLGATDLWVINVTKAAAGIEIKCDVSDLNCLRLTSALTIDQDSGLGIHGFFGDTLIYYDDTGPIYAWRPGWLAGRRLSDETGVFCSGHPKAPVAYCYQNGDGTTVPTQVTYDFHAGTLPADDSGTPLPKIEKQLLFTDDDPPNVFKFQADFSPAGDRIAWSARPDAAGVETLKIQTVQDSASRVVVAADVSNWRISSDEAAYYWLKHFNYDTLGGASGILETAGYPGGAAPVMLLPSVGDFTTSGSKGVIVRSGVTAGKGQLAIISDRAMPTAVTVLEEGVLSVWDVSRDGKSAIYSKKASIDGFFDLFVGGLDLGTGCPLVRDPDAFSLVRFSDSGDLAVWAKINNTTGQVGGFATILRNSDGTMACRSQAFAADTVGFTVVQDQGLVYEDLSADGRDVSLRYGKRSGDTLQSTGTLVQDRVGTDYAVMVPALPAVLFTIFESSGADGLYINASLPFGATSTPADGGAPPPDGGGGDGDSDGG